MELQWILWVSQMFCSSSVQRRHQKVIEMAPAWTLPDSLRRELHQYALQLTSAAKYKNAGTVEFLVDSDMRPYFVSNSV